MKIRHKQSGVELEGSFCECSSGSLSSPAQYYFMANDGNSRYDKREWEEVKPAWKDVTLECSLLQGVRLWHGEDVIADLRYGYRLRKIPVWVGNLSLKSQDAFIIEQRQS